MILVGDEPNFTEQDRSRLGEKDGSDRFASSPSNCLSAAHTSQLLPACTGYNLESIGTWGASKRTLFG